MWGAYTLSIEASEALTGVIECLKKKFNGGVKSVELISPYKAIVEVDNDALVEITRYLFDELGFLYSTSAGVDESGLGGGFGVYHILSNDKMRIYVILKVKGGDWSFKVKSITPVIPGANWAEREIRDILGVEFEGHPDPRRLVLPDDWPEGVYPLRKDFKHDNKSVPREPREYPLKKAGLSETALPVGPYHPALHEPEYFKLFVEGDTVVDAEYRGFCVYRGIEKLVEGRMNYNQIPFIAERICGICGYTHSCCYCQALEEAAGIEVPERALYIRTILLELERIHSHLLLIGVAMHLLGYDTGFMHLWRIREAVMDLCEDLTGNRKTYGMNLPGGVRRDIDEKRVEAVKRVLDKLEEDYKRIINVIASLREIRERTIEIGVLDKETARRISVVGPVARASGLDRDVRRDHPYAAYGDLEFKVPVYSEGDVWARVMVRVEEVFESISIVRQALDRMPKGEITAKVKSIPSGRYGMSATEAPRGEDVHFLITGKGNRVYRWKVRAPTYNNLPAVPYMLRGYKLADAPIIIASIDPCFSCTDRLVVVDVRSSRKRVFSARELARGGGAL